MIPQPLRFAHWALDRLAHGQETRSDKTLGKADADKIPAPVWLNDIF